MVILSTVTSDFAKNKTYSGFRLRFFTTDLASLECCFLRGLRTIKFKPDTLYCISGSDFCLTCSELSSLLPGRWQLSVFPGRLYLIWVTTLSAQLLLKRVLNLSMSGQYYALYGMPPVHGDPLTFF